MTNRTFRVFKIPPHKKQLHIEENSSRYHLKLVIKTTINNGHLESMCYPRGVTTLTLLPNILCLNPFRKKHWASTN